MLSVYVRHRSTCKYKDEPTSRRCSCTKWLVGTLPGRKGRFRTSAKTTSWEQAEGIARQYEAAAAGGQDMEAAMSLPTVKDAVDAYLADARARGLVEDTVRKLTTIFEKQLLSFCEQEEIRFLRDLKTKDLTAWRKNWKDGQLARKKQHERVVGFFWFCVRQGWIPQNPAQAMGKIIAKHTPTDYFPKPEYAVILDACGRLDDGIKRAYDIEKRGARILALTELMRWSGLRIRDAVTLEKTRLEGGKLFPLPGQNRRAGLRGSAAACGRVALESSPGPKPNPRYFFWSGNGTPQSAVADWQRAYRRLFEVAGLKKPDSERKRCHPHMFRDTFAIELLPAGVPIDQVSVLLGHKSVKITEKHYSPWVKARQDQLEKSVQAAWPQADNGKAEGQKDRDTTEAGIEEPETVGAEKKTY
jgi:integrase/recombinase XerD